MTTILYREFVVAIAIATIVTGCATQAPPEQSPNPILQARQKLNADLRDCTQQYGYDPAKATGIAQNALAPNELEWRQCVYRALRPYAQANPSMAPMYESLIANDIAMTAAIQQGTMTRSQRRARIEELVADIKATENKMIAAATAEQQRQAQEFNNTISAIRALGP
jgi:hypothetical protein